MPRHTPTRLTQPNNKKLLGGTAGVALAGLVGVAAAGTMLYVAVQPPTAATAYTPTSPTDQNTYRAPDTPAAPQVVTLPPPPAQPDNTPETETAPDAPTSTGAMSSLLNAKLEAYFRQRNQAHDAPLQLIKEEEPLSQDLAEDAPAPRTHRASGGAPRTERRDPARSGSGLSTTAGGSGGGGGGASLGSGASAGGGGGGGGGGAPSPTPETQKPDDTPDLAPALGGGGIGSVPDDGPIDDELLDNTGDTQALESEDETEAVEPEDNDDHDNDTAAPPPPPAPPADDYLTPMSDAEIDAARDTHAAGAVVLSPGTGVSDHTAMIQAALDAGGTIRLTTGTYHITSLELDTPGTVLVADPGTTLRVINGQTGRWALRIKADGCTLIDLDIDANAQNSPFSEYSQSAILVSSSDNHLMRCTARNAGRYRESPRRYHVGINVYGHRNTLDRCVSHDSAYTGFGNRGDHNLYRACRAYDYYFKGINQGNRGRPVEQITISDWYAESDRGLTDGTNTTGLLIDSSNHPVRKVRLYDIVIGPHPGGTGGMKIAVADDVLIDGLTLDHALPGNLAGLRLAEGLGDVTVRNGSIRTAITHYPGAQGEHGEREVRILRLENLTVGGDETSAFIHLYDRILARELHITNCTFRGIRRTAFKPETDNDLITTWKITGCDFIVHDDATHPRPQVMFPLLDQAERSLTLRESGKLVFLDNTLQSPPQSPLLLCQLDWFARLLQTTNDTATRYAAETPPFDTRVFWHQGTVLSPPGSPHEWACTAAGAPGVWQSMSFD